MKKKGVVNQSSSPIDYEVDEQQVEKFLSDSADSGYYSTQLSEIASNTRKVLYIRLDDMVDFEQDHDSKLLKKVQKNTWRYKDMFESCADNILEKLYFEASGNGSSLDDDQMEVL